MLADGRMVRAGEDGEPDLLWALRGGGGNFGVVTALRFRLHPLGAVTGGPMLWPLEDAERVLGLYLHWLPEQPDDVSAFFAVIAVPPADPFPEPIRLRPVCALVWCNTAPPEASAAALGEFRAAAPPPLLDGVAELPYPALQSAFDPIAEAGTHNHISRAVLPRAPRGGRRGVRPLRRSAPNWLSFTHLYPLDGAAARRPDGDAAWPWRHAAFAQMFLGCAAGPGQDDELRDWAAGFSDALASYAFGGAYSNFVMDEGSAAARACYGDSHPRLRELKARYDPANVFRSNQNIEP